MSSASVRLVRSVVLVVRIVGASAALAEVSLPDGTEPLRTHTEALSCPHVGLRSCVPPSAELTLWTDDSMFSDIREQAPSLAKVGRPRPRRRVPWVLGLLVALFGLLSEAENERRWRQDRQELRIARQRSEAVLSSRNDDVALLPEAGAESRSDAVGVSGSPGGRTPWARGVVSATEKIRRQLKSILNKLTRDNYWSLHTQLLEVCFKARGDEGLVEVLACELFAKATTEHEFVEMYADLCAVLHGELQDIGVKCSLNQALLRMCEQTFNRYLEAFAVDDALTEDDQYVEYVKYKTKMLGNVKFMSQLLRRGMAPQKMLLLCAERLLSVNSADALETLSVLLTCASVDAPQCVEQQHMQQVFRRVSALAVDQQQPQRVRCLLQDLLDKWKGPV